MPSLVGRLDYTDHIPETRVGYIMISAIVVVPFPGIVGSFRMLRISTGVFRPSGKTVSLVRDPLTMVGPIETINLHDTRGQLGTDGSELSWRSSQGDYVGVP